jgi:crossover junction endodeoxyribonuclease RuvC
MIALGIDPGTTRIGFGVIEYNRSSFRCIDYGIIKNTVKDRSENYKNTAKELNILIKKYRPDICGIEKLFFLNNQKTVMSVSEMRGVIILTVAQNNIPIEEPTPLQIKQSISNYGRAGKAQVQKMVQMILGIKEEIRPDDAADALAIAICSANNYTPPIIK